MLGKHLQGWPYIKPVMDQHPAFFYYHAIQTVQGKADVFPWSDYLREEDDDEVILLRTVLRSLSLSSRPRLSPPASRLLFSLSSCSSWRLRDRGALAVVPVLPSEEDDTDDSDALLDETEEDEGSETGGMVVPGSEAADVAEVEGGALVRLET